MENNDFTLLCKHCKHSSVPLMLKIFSFGIIPIDGYFYKCKRSLEEEHTKFDPVTGPYKVKPKYNSCNWERVSSEKDRCGKEGKFWTPKHKKHLFLVLIKD